MHKFAYSRRIYCLSCYEINSKYGDFELDCVAQLSGKQIFLYWLVHHATKVLHASSSVNYRTKRCTTKRSAETFEFFGAKVF